MRPTCHVSVEERGRSIPDPAFVPYSINPQIEGLKAPSE
jgi:hypothetical protein